MSQKHHQKDHLQLGKFLRFSSDYVDCVYQFHRSLHLKIKPLLLLDDIFDKLDDNRVSQLIELVNQQNFGQIFITDTHRERTESVVKRINEESKIFQI